MSDPVTAVVPDPPAVAILETLSLQRETWSAQAPIHRIYRIDRSPTEFNPGHGSGRFHPIRTVGDARSIPTLYGGTSLIGGLCETLFRLEPANRTLPHPVPKKRVLQHGYATVGSKRDLTLLPLKGDNLRAVGIVRAQLLEPGPAHYETTAGWASALHAAFPDIDGLIWISRQHDESQCLLLFGDRVQESSLVTVQRVSFEPPAGWQMLLAAAQQAGFVVTED